MLGIFEIIEFSSALFTISNNRFVPLMNFSFFHFYFKLFDW